VVVLLRKECHVGIVTKRGVSKMPHAEVYREHICSRCSTVLLCEADEDIALCDCKGGHWLYNSGKGRSWKWIKEVE